MTQPIRITPTIKHFTLKKIVRYEGRGGMPLAQAELFFKKKRVAFYKEDDRMIDSSIQWDAKTTPLIEEAKAALAQYVEENKGSEDVELLKEDALPVRLLELKEYSEAYRKSLKKGFDGIAVVDFEGNEVLLFHCKKSNVEQVKKMAKEEAMKDKKALISVSTFFAVEDFIVE